MHNESPLQICRVEPCSADEKQPSMARLNSPGDAPENGIEQQRRRARRTAMWVGAIAVLVYVGFILSGVIGR
ncbi:hypothetical protein EGJ03_20395 [Stenotrophomonas maltophilia]|uniref:hypothetical protein n=1 Tax=Stenotrophomonas geniculata TaxID=86188 RepID=UPI000F687A6F|nr:hypothetical protein EGJ06_18905 [Stenotrophomonas maltophilia]RRU07442.1 hypothetical protein EGJ77_18825 [Stenotrophomonas maltophilia]RRU26097.1 hypothetical protein EGJ03_20395 [Stenotrophomonas maltophilia]RRU89922.1 hypothetical protein EGI91_19730 [Stenotrophomonas maltophilia]